MFTQTSDVLFAASVAYYTSPDEYTGFRQCIEKIQLSCDSLIDLYCRELLSFPPQAVYFLVEGYYKLCLIS